MLACQRYIEWNPVSAGLVAHPAEYRWSSYRANAQGEEDVLVTPCGMHEIIHYLDEAEKDLYRDWLDSLRDRVVKVAIMLTSGGDKKSQSRDIERAVKLLKDWEKRNG